MKLMDLVTIFIIIGVTVGIILFPDQRVFFLAFGVSFAAGYGFQILREKRQNKNKG